MPKKLGAFSKKSVRVMLTAIVLLGLGLRLYNLGGSDFYDDEYQVVGAAYNYVKKGDYYQWDFLRDISQVDRKDMEVPPEQYTRAWPHTWMVAQSFRTLGFSEWAGRMPSVIFGTLLILVAYYFARRFTDSVPVSLLFSALIAVLPVFIEVSRFTRMYIVWVPVFLLMAYALFRGLEGRLPFRKKPAWFDWIDFDYRYLGVAMVLGLASFVLHVNTVVFAPGVLFFSMYMAIRWGEKRHALLSLLGVGLLTLAFALASRGTDPLNLSLHVAAREVPNWVYVRFIFGRPFTPAVGFLLVLMALMQSFIQESRIQKIRLAYLFSGVLTTTLFFVFFANRYAAVSYVLNVVPFAILLSVVGFSSVWRLFRSRLMHWVLAVAFVVSLIIPFRREFYKMFDFSGMPSFRQAYHEIVRDYDPGEDILLAQYLRGYYMRKVARPLQFVNLETNQTFTFSQFFQALTDYPSGYITWETGKSYHVDPRIREYCCRYLKQLHGNMCGRMVDGTNVEVFRFTRENYEPGEMRCEDDDPSDCKIHFPDSGESVRRQDPPVSVFSGPES